MAKTFNSDPENKVGNGNCQNNKQSNAQNNYENNKQNGYCDALENQLEHLGKG